MISFALSGQKEEKRGKAKHNARVVSVSEDVNLFSFLPRRTDVTLLRRC